MRALPHPYRQQCMLHRMRKPAPWRAADMLSIARALASRPLRYQVPRTIGACVKVRVRIDRGYPMVPPSKRMR